MYTASSLHGMRQGLVGGEHCWDCSCSLNCHGHKFCWESEETMGIENEFSFCFGRTRHWAPLMEPGEGQILTCIAIDLEKQTPRTLGVVREQFLTG